MPRGERLIGKREVKREWLVRCSDNDYQLDVVSVAANNGTLTITGLDREVQFNFERSQIAEFRSVLDAAINQCETDLRHKALQ